VLVANKILQFLTGGAGVGPVQWLKTVAVVVVFGCCQQFDLKQVNICWRNCERVVFYILFLQYAAVAISAITQLRMLLYVVLGIIILVHCLFPQVWSGG